MSDPIHVDYEYGDLKEVIVGRGVMRYPDVEYAGWAAEGIKVLPKAEAEKAWQRSGKDSRDLPKYELMEAENAELIAILERFNVTVHRPEEISDKQVAANYGTEWLVNGYQQAYSRDPIFVVGDNVIELVLGAPNRRAELLGYRKLFLERVLGSGARWFQMPLADVTAIGGHNYSKEAFPTLEGGDLIVLGKTILAGTSLNKVMGSSAAGVEWLRSQLGPQGYDVQRVRIGENFLHLDVCLSVPRDGLAIVCPDAFVDGMPSYLQGWDLIEVSADQARLLACNGLPINADNYILGFNEDEDGTTVQSGLEARGITRSPGVFWKPHRGRRVDPLLDASPRAPPREKQCGLSDIAQREYEAWRDPAPRKFRPCTEVFCQADLPNFKPLLFNQISAYGTKRTLSSVCRNLRTWGVKRT